MSKSSVSKNRLLISIEKRTKSNRAFRKIISTTPQQQLVLMSVVDNIPREKHPRTTQFIRVEAGHGTIEVAGKVMRVKDGDAVIIPPNTWHEVKNTGKTPLKLYTIYSPPHH